MSNKSAFLIKHIMNEIRYNNRLSQWYKYNSYFSKQKYGEQKHVPKQNNLYIDDLKFYNCILIKKKG